MDGKDGNKNGASVWLFGRGQDRVDGGNRIEPATRSERVRERIRAHHRKIKMLTKLCSSKIISQTHFLNSRKCTMKKLFLETYLSNLHAFCTPSLFQKKLTPFHFSVWTCFQCLEVCLHECILTNVSQRVHIYRKPIERVSRCYF